MSTTPTRRPARPSRRLAVLAAAALALPLAAAAAHADPPTPGITVAPGRTATLPSVATLSGLRVENSFVSGVGWVKPGDTYPSRVLLRNDTAAPVANVVVTVPQVRGMRWTDSRAAVGTETLAGGVVRWSVPSVPATSSLALVLEAAADTLAQEPTIVWRDISSIASVSVAGGAPTKLASHGPKVIPPTGGYETARYGDRPFPVVPVDYADFTHATSAAELDKVINDPKNPSSTYNLYQEMSFGQLYPHGTIGSVGVQSRPVADTDALRFTTIDPTSASTCTGVTSVDPSSGEPTPLYTNRIVDGWYQLPGQRGYYGADANGSAVVGSLAGVAALQAIDSGCGPTAKTAYDAAVVADPDIDYSDFDTDKDGVVDFFEVVYQGCGGNGASQLGPVGGCAPTDTGDNIWPHSSSLEFTYTDAKTGLTGYISKDQLKNLEGQPLWYTNNTYTTKTTKNMGDELKVFVRVGPYNVNPETSIEFASVISHEYGHSLGLPDYYSTGSRETYGDFNLMATDKGHNIDVIGKKELGWIVPKVLKAGEKRSVKDWRDSKVDTGTIDWVTPDGTPYTLTAKGGDYGIHNGEAYAAALPGRQLLDPDKIKQGASGKRVWYSRQGNDFGCAPVGGHNLDFAIPGIDKVPAGTKITATFKTFFDIEWDYDYAFVLTGKPDDKGAYSYTSHASDNGYTTPGTQNPNGNSCQTKFGNGITGTPASYDAGTAPVDRVTGDVPDGPFVQDSYDVSSLAGVKGGVLRFSYSTDPGLARLGWIIDDLVVKAGDKVLFKSDFEDGDGGSDDPRVYNGGCKEDLSTSGGLCTEGWSYLAAGTPSELEHGYLMEMRDRSGFDIDGRGESDRGPTEFEPGLLLTYTDEAHGYGNVGTDNPPAQSPLDSTPDVESDTPDLTDATFVPRMSEPAAPGVLDPILGGSPAPAVNRGVFSDAKATPHLDNYAEPARGENKAAGGTQPWTFDYSCLGFTVDKLTGDMTNTADTFDLAGDVSFTMGSGCAPFNYGNVVAPAAVAGELVTLATPQRVLDNRNGTGTTRGAKTGAVVLDLTGKVPAGAKAAVLNVTVDKPSARGFVTVYPGGGTVPGTSNVNFAAGQTQANEVVVALPASRQVVLKVTNSSANVIADLIGYTTDASAADAGSPVALASPVRALDTRERSTGKRVTGEVQVALPAAVPADAAAVLLNVTLTGPDRAGFAVVYPTGASRPGTSNVNVSPGQTQANEVLTRIGTGRKVSVTLVNTTASVVVDVVGYVAAAAKAPSGQLAALPVPLRAVDTREGVGTAKGQKSGAFRIARPAGVPAEATAVVLNVTSTRATGSGFITVYPGGGSKPGTSNVNFRQGLNQANEVLTKLGSDGSVTVFVGGSGAPRSDVIVDVVGYLVP